MQQIYQQQMEAQANHTINNEEKKSSGIEIPDLSTLHLENVDQAAAFANNNDLVLRDHSNNTWHFFGLF